MSDINLDRIGWQNGTLVSKAKVEINGVIYEVEPEEYSGSTPLSAENLIQMESNTENAINEVQDNLEALIRTVWTDINLGSFNANQDKYDQEQVISSTDIPEGYLPIGIVGYGLYGGYYSHCFLSKLLLNSEQRKIMWSAKNTYNGSISNIHCNVAILCMKI